MSVAVGIDLGTTNTVVGVVRDGLAFTIPDPNGRRLVPSTVSFHPTGRVLVGYPAVDRRIVDAPNTIYSVKRLIGRAWGSPEIEAARTRMPFKLVEGDKQSVAVEARGERYSLPEISAFVLRYAKATAEATLGEPVDRAVITVPANFSDPQRAATKIAGKLAGLDILRILNEPTAAALAYGQGAGVAANDSAVALLAQIEQADKGERVAVYDLGGGTFDITILDLSGNVFEVLSTAGDTSLGGDDFDDAIATRVAEDVLKRHRFDARSNPQAFGQLRMIAESMKCALSSQEEHTIPVADASFGFASKPLPLDFRMSRTELEWASLELLERTFAVCRTALERAKVGPNAIERVILVGGSTKMPLVARKVEQFFGKAPAMRVNPDEVVALGAAIQAQALDRGGRRRGTGAQPPAPPTIARESLRVSAPHATPAPPPVSEEPATPMLPIVGPSNPAPRATPPPIAAPAPPRLRVDSDPPAFLANALVSMSELDDLDEALPAPTLSPPVASAPESEPPTLEPVVSSLPSVPPDAGRPLVFDLPPSALPAARPPALPATTRTARGLAPPDFTATLPIIGGPNAAPRAPPPFVPPPRQAPPPPPVAVLAPTPQTRTRPLPAKAPLLIDVTPLRLSVETVGGYCDTILAQNTPIPCDRTRVFMTASDNQTSVSVRVAQGESPKFAENAYLGELELSGFKPARRGDVEISVTFEIDADGILNVRAKEARSGLETVARMHLIGAQIDEAELRKMQERQARHAVG
jgi:molecular chaperone DnaK